MASDITAMFVIEDQGIGSKERKQKEGVMVRQDYMFMALLILSLVMFTHWGGFHNLRH
jgi:hypothetical protein